MPIDETERERRMQESRLQRTLNERARDTSTSTTLLVLGIALLVVGALPWLTTGSDDRGDSALDADGALDWLILVVVVGTGLGSAVAGRVQPHGVRVHRVLAVPALLTVATAVVLAVGAGNSTRVETAPGLWLGMVIAMALAAEHLAAARRR